MEVFHASARSDSLSVKLDIMADTPSSNLSFLIREAEFVCLGLDLVFYGTLAFVVARDLSYLLNPGIYTTLGLDSIEHQ